MGMHEGRWMGGLREQPPVWPKRESERRLTRGRREREREPFEDGAGYELYPGATVLEDLVPGGEDGRTLRVLARYTVIRLLVLSAAGRLAGAKLFTERRVALQHIALLPAPDWERLSLARVARLCAYPAEPAVLDAALVAAECAAKREQVMGAFGLYRAVFEIALGYGWWEAAERAARGISGLARLFEMPVSRRVWEWRARVVADRQRREEEAAAQAAAAPGVDGPSDADAP